MERCFEVVNIANSLSTGNKNEKKKNLAGGRLAGLFFSVLATLLLRFSAKKKIFPEMASSRFDSKSNQHKIGTHLVSLFRSWTGCSPFERPRFDRFRDVSVGSLWESMGWPPSKFCFVLLPLAVCAQDENT